MFQPGQSGNPNGRPKGSVNKCTDFTDIRNQLISVGFDPIEAMIEMAMHADDIDIRFKATKTLLDRLVPVLKAIEVKGDLGTSYMLNLNFPQSEK